MAAVGGHAASFDKRTIPLSPKDRARIAIDALLLQAGWLIQDNADLDRHAGFGTVDARFHLPVRDRRTRAARYKQFDADLPFTKQELDASVTVPNQIRLVLSTFRD